MNISVSTEQYPRFLVAPPAVASNQLVPSPTPLPSRSTSLPFLYKQFTWVPWPTSFPQNLCSPSTLRSMSVRVPSIFPLGSFVSWRLHSGERHTPAFPDGQMDAFLPPKVNACILLGYVTHGYHWTPLTPTQESFQRAEATFLSTPIPFPQEYWSLDLKPAGWFSAFTNRYNLFASFSDSSFCWGKEPSIALCLRAMSVPEMLSIKGPGNGGTFSFPDKSRH